MRIIVNKNYVLFDVNTKVNKREFKATPLEFTFSEEYEGLTCKCVFSKIPATQDEEVTFYQQPIIDNECYIPYEVMDGEGILIGVYGYSVDGDELLLRYSPKPKNLWFLEGSYYEGAETPEEIQPSQFEQYVAYLNSQIARLNQIKIETEQLSDGVKISVTNADGQTSETEVYNGETGPQGPQGEPGSGIAGKIYNFEEVGYYEVTYTSGSQFEMATDLLDDINNNRSFTASLVRPLYIATGEDGPKGFTFVNYVLDTNSLVLNFSYSGEIGDYFESINRPGLKTTSVTITLTDGEVSSITFPYIEQTVKRYLSTINSEAYTPTSDYHPSTKKYVDDGLSSKQNTLVSGTNIKTINSKDITGSGNVDIVQVSTLPTADSSNVGVIYQYIGATTADYTQGFFYQCVSDGEETPTYSWENIEVQASSGGDSYKQIYFLTTNVSALFGPTSLNATDIATLNKVIDDYRAGKDVLLIAKNMSFWGSDNQTLSCFNVIGIISSASNWVSISFYSNRYQGDKITTWELSMYRNLRLNNVGTPANITSASFPAVNPPNEIHNLIPPKTITGYDATKTQVLKNVNGTLTWVDEA